MDPRPLDQARFERIEAFLTGSLVGPEEVAFRVEMEQDAVLREEVEAQRENMLAVQLGGFERMVRTTMEAGTSRSSSATWLRYAAAVLVVCGVATWFVSRPSSNESSFAAYHMVDPGLPVPMSVLGDPAFHDGMVSFKQGAFAEARATWSPLLIAEPQNDTLLYSTALTHLEQHDDRQAQPLLHAVALQGGSVFAAKAKWYLFLSYLRSGDRPAALALGMEQDSIHGEQVRAILDTWKP